MNLKIFKEADGFLSKAQAWLEERETENSLVIGIAFRLRKHPEHFKPNPFFGMIEHRGVPRIAAVMTPPHNLVLAGQPDEEAFETLSSGLREQGWSLPGVVGPNETSRAFSSSWGKAAGVSARTGLQMRLYQLERVIPPAPVPGGLRVAQAEDIPLLSGWIAAFQEEAINKSPNHDDVRRQAEILVSEGQVFIWEDREPVCMAASARPTRNGITINYVYTQPEGRRKGFASACVAALSQHLLDSGYKFCCLFTDLANPTSNHIYMNVGYRPLRDFEEQRFDDLAPERGPGNPGG